MNHHFTKLVKLSLAVVAKNNNFIKTVGEL